MTCRRAARIMLAAVFVHGCADGGAPRSNPHYVLGLPYRMGSYWFYPRASDSLNETGIAVVARGGHALLTSDGEAFDQTALAAAHPTLQLPAIARLTNLDNGLQVTVRVNDRGSPSPHRLVEVTQRTALLLQMTGPVAPVRLQVLSAESQAAADALPGAPRLVMSVAPREAVDVAELPPPPGVQENGLTKVAGSILPSVDARLLEADTVIPPLRLREIVFRTPPRPGRLMVHLDTFSDYQYAAMQRARMSGAGAQIVSVREENVLQFRVQIGPLQDVAHADAILDRVLAAGIPDARIVID